MTDYDTSHTARDRHAELAASLRQLADYLDTIEPLPLPAWHPGVEYMACTLGANWSWTTDPELQIARVCTWATRLGVEPVVSERAGASYWSASRRFGRVKFGITCIDNRLAVAS